MSDPIKPPLSAYQWERIEVERYAIQRKFADHLTITGIVTQSFDGNWMDAMANGLRAPKQPIHVGMLLGSYAVDLFNSEASHYPPIHENTQAWLANLAGRVEQIVIQHVAKISPMGSKLSYHATEEEMRKAIRDATHEAIRARQAAKQMNSETAPTATLSRMSSVVKSPDAARKMEAYLIANGIGLTQFAITAGTTDRTLRNFRKTGKIRRDIFEGIAKAMGITKEALLKL